MRKTRLFTPGPTPLSPMVQEALGRPIIHHRTPEFQALLSRLSSNLKTIYKTRNDIVIFASSGTGAMEAAVAGLLHPDRGGALAVVIGKFGERWVEICQTHGIRCTVLERAPGQAASAQEIEEALSRNPSIEAVLLQGCETSTATSHDLQAIGDLLGRRHPGVLVVVDGITTVGCQELETDAWGLDVVIGGSQKAFAVPPGLAFLSVSERAAERMRTNPRRAYYLDLIKELEGQKAGRTAYTPAVSLVAALLASTEAILEEGLDQILEETEQMARCTRAGLQALGFTLLSSAPSPAATAAYPPPGISAAQLSQALERRFGVKVAGGQGALKGKIIRIAHLGYFDLLDMFAILSALELLLSEMGAEGRTAGAGVAAALREASGSRCLERA